MTLSAAMKACLILCAIVVCVSGVQAAITVDAGPDQTVNVGEKVAIKAVYNDTATAAVKNRSAMINWTLVAVPGTLIADDDLNGTVTGTHTFTLPGTYIVAVNVSNTETGTWKNDTLVITVKAMSMETKIVPRTLNMKSHGVMTVFLSPEDWWTDADLGTIRKDALNKDMVSFLGAMPYKINFCQKDGGTFILKFRRQDLDLDGIKGELTVTGNLTTKNGDVAFEGSDSIQVKNLDSAGKKYSKSSVNDEGGEEGDNGNHDRVKEQKNGNGHGKK